MLFIMSKLKLVVSVLIIISECLSIGCVTLNRSKRFLISEKWSAPMAKTFKRNYRGRMEWVLYQRPLFLNGIAFLVLVLAWLVRVIVIALNGLGVVLDCLSVFSFWFLLVAFLVVLLVLTVRVVRFAEDLKTFGGYSEYMTHKRAIKDVEKGLLSAGLVRKVVG